MCTIKRLHVVVKLLVIVTAYYMYIKYFCPQVTNKLLAICTVLQHVVLRIVFTYVLLFLVLFYLGFALCLYCFYIMSPITMKYSSATLVNLSILTGNVYNLCWGLFLFNYKVSNVVHY